MSASNWPIAFKKTETFEGWHIFVNDRFDPGGATYSGVIQRTYNAWRASKHLPMRSVAKMTDDECSAIMKANYWDAIRGDELPSGVDFLLYDIAVNMGPVTAIRFLQSAVNVVVDGQFGILTMQATKSVSDVEALIEHIAELRMSRWHALSTWWRFGRGWSTRGASAEQFALHLASSNPT